MRRGAQVRATFHASFESLPGFFSVSAARFA